MVQKDRSTLREQYENHWKQTGEKPDALDFEPCPEELKYLWRWFVELNQGRGNSGFGPCALSYLEIEAWSRLNRVVLMPHELKALKQLDVVYLNSQGEATK